MISRIDLRGRALDARSLREVLPRAELDVEAALSVVRPICDDVRQRGAEALRDLGERFDGVRPGQLRVPAAVLTAALDLLDPAVRAALEETIRRARIVHEDQPHEPTPPFHTDQRGGGWDHGEHHGPYYPPEAGHTGRRRARQPKLRG